MLTLSYSAAGEDRLVLSWSQVAYQLNDGANIRYCDIGAAHPTRLNNTKFISIELAPRGSLSSPTRSKPTVLHKARPGDTF